MMDTTQIGNFGPGGPVDESGAPNQKPKVLWLARTLPLNAGDRIYTAELATSLAQAGASVTFFCLANPDEPLRGRLFSSDRLECVEVPGIRPAESSRLRAPSLWPRYGSTLRATEQNSLADFVGIT